MTAAPLLALLVVAGTPPYEKRPPKAATIADAWLALPASGQECGDADLGHDYGVEGGMRNFYCRAKQVFTWRQLTALAPPPFRSGPHSDAGLDLNAEKDFGHYNPDFVRWASKALIPAAEDRALKEKTQRLYDAQVRSLARLYFLVWRVASKDPQWLAAERTRYRAALERGGGSWSGADVDLYHELLGTSGNDWGGNDPNHVRSATMWWLRRSIDETAPLWAQGLERLLKTYDPAWLAAEKKKPPPEPPKREPKRE